jgi:hypothetical protein
MQIDLLHQGTQVTVILSTEGNSPDVPVRPRITAKTEDSTIKSHLEDRLRQELNNSIGFYGHTIDIESVTNLDLSAGARSLSSFKMVSIKPKITPSALPKGALS